MFFGQNRQKAISTETLATLMDSSVKIEGNFYFDKSARLDGVIIGNISGPNTKTGVLIVGPKARIDGDISCHSVVVLGAVLGDIEADHLEVRAGAKINGDVRYSVIEVHQGSNINGRMILKNNETEKSTTQETDHNPKTKLAKSKSQIQTKIPPISTNKQTLASQEVEKIFPNQKI